MPDLFDTLVRGSFTGTQKGMTPHQKIVLKYQFKKEQLGWLYNGSCIGADEQAANIALDLGIKVECLPGKPIGDPKRVIIKRASVTRLVEEPLKRNRIMVNLSDLLIATPGEYEEQLRSGTWYTIRYARLQEKRIIIIFPGGEVKEEQFDH